MVGGLRSPFKAFALALATACAAVAVFAAVTAEGPRPVFVTWEGIGPDKWASIWLIRRHIDPGAEIRIVPVNGDTRIGQGFDFEGAPYLRDANSTTFTQMRKALLPEAGSAEIGHLSKMIDEMEIRRWGVVDSSDTGILEEGYRNLQLAFDARDGVPFACYMAFFDRVETTLATTGGRLDRAITVPDTTACAGSQESGAARAETVAEMPVRAILDRIAAGQEVVFIDTREAAEFAEAHIPGAAHIPLRDIDAAMGAKLASADLVVPYCVKDFRGYEVARALSRLGVPDVAVMNPYGIRGWSQAGLPISGARGKPAAAAEAALAACAADAACGG